MWPEFPLEGNMRNYEHSRTANRIQMFHDIAASGSFLDDSAIKNLRDSLLTEKPWCGASLEEMAVTNKKAIPKRAIDWVIMN
jgi:hypothetical protein